jgi:uncharacterized protein
MNKDYQRLIQWTQSNDKKLFKTTEKLKSQKRLDSAIHSAHNKAFREIDCLECGNCCKTTGPLLLSSDIARISKKLKIAESAFVSKYLRLDEEGDHVFKNMPCPFLGEANLCSIYEFRPKACREFPHTNQSGQLDIMHLTRKNAKICPAVSRIFQIISEL